MFKDMYRKIYIDLIAVVMYVCMYVYVCVCVCVCVRARARARVCVYCMNQFIIGRII